MAEDLNVLLGVCPHVKRRIRGQVHGTVALVPPFSYFLISDLNSNQTVECSSQDDCFWAVSQLYEPKGVSSSWAQTGGCWVSDPPVHDRCRAHLHSQDMAADSASSTDTQPRCKCSSGPPSTWQPPVLSH